MTVSSTTISRQHVKEIIDQLGLSEVQVKDVEEVAQKIFEQKGCISSISLQNNLTIALVDLEKTNEVEIKWSTIYGNQKDICASIGSNRVSILGCRDSVTTAAVYWTQLKSSSSIA